ncbi:hypothetical protein [Cryobacterium arcticum]|uniref:Lipoprotein n=1 Tax=Cryobacterium arcticum TaxID=670052 RepID=A0A1B1BPQ2_9MICO|nr:hypothetical protein [Cryobacterium arcticum]ANP74650.1 hypothetical protein PA27867_3733 [Cryobacterium arcticum]
MQRRTKTGPAWVAGLLVVGVAVALSGCAAGTANPHIGAVLGTPREAEDAWPVDTEDLDIDLDSSRLVGTLDHVDYFVASYSDADTDDGVCLLLSGPDGHFVAACSPSESGMSMFGIGVGSARVSADTVTYPASAGWVQLTDFLLVNPGASAP